MNNPLESIFGKKSILSKIDMESSSLFEFILTDEITRKRIVDYIKPKYSDSMSYQNLNLAYGVIDKNRKIYLILSYYVSQSIKRCDDGVDDYTFVVLTDNSEFKVDCQMDTKKNLYNISISRGFEQYLEAVGQGIAFYQNYEEKKAFENQLKSLNPEFRLYELQSQLKDELIDNIKEGAPIDSVQEARELFLKSRCSGSYLRNKYSKHTVQNYEKYVDEQTEFKWRTEEYIRLLTEIKNRHAVNYSANLTTAKWLCEQGVSDNDETLYTEAWETLFCDNIIKEDDFRILSDFIIMYQYKFKDRVDKIQSVLEIADDYIKKHFLNDYKNTNGFTAIRIYNMNAKHLRKGIS